MGVFIRGSMDQIQSTATDTYHRPGGEVGLDMVELCSGSGEKAIFGYSGKAGLERNGLDAPVTRQRMHYVRSNRSQCLS